MGNGMCERFNKTLLNMLGTLKDDQKSDLKSHVSTLTHAYTAAVHKSTGFAPFYLMYGRHPRHSTDVFLDIGDGAVKTKSHADYVNKLKQSLSSAYETAAREDELSAKEQKRFFDLQIRNSVCFSRRRPCPCPQGWRSGEAEAEGYMGKTTMHH